MPIKLEALRRRSNNFLNAACPLLYHYCRQTGNPLCTRENGRFSLRCCRLNERDTVVLPSMAQYEGLEVYVAW